MEGQEDSVTPNDDNRSMVEQCLIDALDDYIASGNETVRQLAQLAKDLIQLTGDQPIVRDYINMKAALALDEESSAW